MNFAEARELVKAHPKKIGSFVRAKLPAGAIKASTAVNFVRYDFASFTGQTWRYGYSIGDGRVYGHSAIKAEGGVLIDQPNLDVICDQLDSLDFDVDVDVQPRAANTNPSRPSARVSHG